MIVTNKDLQNTFKFCEEQNQLTNEFAELAITIAWSTLNSETFNSISLEIKEDIISYFSLNLVRNWKKIDSTKNIKYYLQTMAGWSTREILRNEKKYRDRKKELVELAERNRSIRINTIVQ